MSTQDQSNVASRADARPRKAAHRRRHSGTALWHMSSQAVSLGLDAVARFSPRECVQFLAEARWGRTEHFECPHCGTVEAHYWKPRELRWKCRACDKSFSVTSGTVFANRRLPLAKLLMAMLTWSNSVAGQPALELRRHLRLSYNAAFGLQGKLREALIRGFNVGLVTGDLDMDGSHRTGRRAAEKRGKPQVSLPRDAQEEADRLRSALQSELTALHAKSNGRPKAKQPDHKGRPHPEFGNRMDKNRRILLAVCQRDVARGKGVRATRVAMARYEDGEAVKATMATYVGIPESMLNTDTSPAYAEVGRRFRAHRTVEHARTLVGPNGENNNQSEGFAARVKRAEKGIYLNIEPKYWLDYGAESAFHQDTRRMPTGEKLKLAARTALNVGPSVYWRGFTHGRHRTDELLVLGPVPAPASGPRKGRHPVASANGRPPR